MTAVTAEQMAEWKALAKAATPGPWRAWRMGNAPLLDGTLVGQSRLAPVPRPYNPHWIGYQNDASALEHHHSTIMCDEDADFTAAARFAVPALVLEVERLREALRTILDRARDDNPHVKLPDIQAIARAALEDGPT